MSSTFVSRIVLRGEDKTKGAFGSAKKSIGGLTSMIAGFTGALSVGGFVLAGKQAIDAADRVGKLSKQLGLSTEFLSEMRHVTELSGSSMETLSTAMGKLQKNAVLAGEGLSSQSRMFERLGISIESVQGLSPEDLFERVGGAIGALEDPTMKAAASMELFGRSGAELIPMFNEGSEGIASMREEARLLGKTLSEDQTAAAEAANDAITRFKAAISGTVQTIAIAFAPTLEGVATFLSQSLPVAIKHAQAAFLILRQTMLTTVSVASGVLATFYESAANWGGALGRSMAGAARDVRGFASIIDDQTAQLQAELAALAEETGEFAFQLGNVATVASSDAAPAIRTLTGGVNGLNDGMQKTLEITYDNPLPDPADIQQTNEAINKTTDAVVELGNEWELAADQAHDAWDNFLGFLPESMRNVVNGFSGAFGGLQNLFMGSMPADGMGPGSPGIFGGLFGSGGQMNPTLAGAFSGFNAGASAFGSDSAGIGGALGGGLAAAVTGGGFLASTAFGAFLAPFAPFLPLLGGLLGSLFSDNNTNTSSEIVFGAFPERAGSDQTIDTAFGAVHVRSGRDGFHEIQGQVTQTVDAFLDAFAQVLTPEQLAAATAAMPSRIHITDDSVESGQFLEPIFGAILSSMEPAVQRFVGQFSDMEQRIKALAVINAVLKSLDSDPLADYADVLARASETTGETMSRLSDELMELGANAFNSVEDMTALGEAWQSYSQQVIETLLGIEGARQSVTAITGSTVDALTFQTLDQTGQYDFLTGRAEQLAAGIGGLGDAASIQNAIQSISQLTSQAFGLAGPENQAGLLDEFTAFLRLAEADAQARLDAIEAETRAQAEADRIAIQDAVRAGSSEGVSDGFGPGNPWYDAGIGFGDGATIIATAAGKMLQAANTPIQITYDSSAIG